MTEITDFTYDGDTWWKTDRDCPDCGDDVASNGSVLGCSSCGWWEVIE